MLTAFAVSGYRSLRDCVFPLDALNLVTGPNGSGKSSLYRALRMLADTAQGLVGASLAREGGLQSALWAGPEQFNAAVQRGEHPVQGTTRRKPVSLRLGFAGDEFGYAIDLGLPIPSRSAFAHDPEIKRECVWAGAVLRPSTLLVDRRGGVVRTREGGGDWAIVADTLTTFDSVMTHAADPRSAPELLLLREQMRGWRFYDHFRTDGDAPARRTQLGTRTPVLGHDGADVAAAVQTILEIGDPQAFDAAVGDAFPGATVGVTSHDGRFDLEMHQRGLLRPLRGAELSDGTLRYLLWVAALLTPRPPALLVLNEPETSLHPDLLPALARLIASAATRTQLVVVSHAPVLVAALRAAPGCLAIVLDKRLGETVAANEDDWVRPAWHWPAR
jgi:predicted ATPase